MLRLCQTLVGLFVQEFRDTPSWETKVEKVSSQLVDMLEAPRDAVRSS